MKLTGMFSRFESIEVLLIGDFMLDAYTTGTIDRISPEAPVTILHADQIDNRPGGAGNVALNFLSLGAAVYAVGRVGFDEAGEQLLSKLKEEGVDVQGILVEKSFTTPKKNRLIANSQQLMRVDFENITPSSEELQRSIVQSVQTLLPKINIVAVSDYGKGLLTPALLQEIISLCKQHDKPIVIDPKGKDFTRYRGATLIKPNLKEARNASHLPPEASLEQVAESILKQTEADMLLITKSKDGISLFYENNDSYEFPVRVREVKDVTGAGDTVLAMICTAMANGLDIKYAAQLANLAAGIAIERIGCARISLSDIASRLLEVDVENKIFDEEHLFALKEALKNREYLIVSLDGNEEMTIRNFHHIYTLSKEYSDHNLIVYIRSSSPSDQCVALLSSLAEIDFVILPCKSIRNLCHLLRPSHVFEIEGEELKAYEEYTTPHLTVSP